MIQLSDFFINIGAHYQTEVSGWSWRIPLRGEWYSFNDISIHDGAVRRIDWGVTLLWTYMVTDILQGPSASAAMVFKLFYRIIPASSRVKAIAIQQTDEQNVVILRCPFANMH